MAPTVAPPAISRTSPTKLATPPTSVRPAVSAASSAPISKSSRWTLIMRAQPPVTGGKSATSSPVFTGGRGRHIPGSRRRGTIERLARAAACLGPRVDSQSSRRADGRDIGRRSHRLLADADLALQPSEIKYLSSMHQYPHRRSVCLTFSACERMFQISVTTEEVPQYDPICCHIGRGGCVNNMTPPGHYLTVTDTTSD